MQRGTRTIGLVGVVAMLTGCWLQPGFDAAHSNWNSGEKQITPANVARVEKLWETAVLVGDLPPVSNGGRIYATGGAARIQALDAATGSLVWNESTAENANSLVYSDGELVMSFAAGSSEDFFGGTVHIAPQTGEIVAVHSVEGAVGRDLSEAGGALALRLDTFLVASPGAPAEARILWTYEPVLEFVIGTSSPGSDFVVVGDRIAWSFGTAAGTTAHGFSPACPGYPPPGPDGCAPDWSSDLGGAAGDPVGVGSDSVAFVVDDTKVTVLDVANGEIRWTADLASVTFKDLAVADGKVFAASADGTVTALDAAGCGAPACAPVWQGNLPSSLTPSGAPVVGGDVLYVPAGNEIVAFAADGCGSRTCPSLATFGPAPMTINDLIVDDGRVIAHSAGALTAFGLPAVDP